MYLLEIIGFFKWARGVLKAPSGSPLTAFDLAALAKAGLFPASHTAPSLTLRPCGCWAAHLLLVERMKATAAPTNGGSP